VIRVQRKRFTIQADDEQRHGVCPHADVDDEDGCGGGRRDNLVQRAREASTRTSLVSFVVLLVHRSHACTIFLGLFLCVCSPVPTTHLSFILSPLSLVTLFVQQSLASSLMEDMRALRLGHYQARVCRPTTRLCV
jgi:hypothetical protein